MSTTATPQPPLDLSLVILNYHSAGLVRQCVRGIREATSELNYEVVVVDNASHDGCLKRLALEFPEVVRVALEVNRGYAAGNNAGLRLARGEFVAILNPDLTVLPGSLERLVAFMRSHPKAGVAGPKLVNPDGTLQLSSYRFPSFWLPLLRRTILGELPLARGRLEAYLMADWDHRDGRTVDWLLGACLVVRHTALGAVGLLDERFFLYVEDTDWCRRFWRHGWEVWYVAEVELVHFHERLSAQPPLAAALFSRITWIHISSWLKYFWKWRSQLQPR